MKYPRVVLGLALAFVGFVGSAMVFYYGWQMKTVAKVAQAEPQQLTAAELIKNGAKDNLHVELTDFAFGKPIIDKTNENWDRVWIPITPAVAGKSKGSADPILFFRSTRIRDQEQLDELVKNSNLDALVVTGSLKKSYWGSGVSSNLYLAYPKLDFDKLTILTEPDIGVPVARMTFKTAALMSPVNTSLAMIVGSGLMVLGFVGAYLIVSNERKPQIMEAIARVDRTENGAGVTNRYISTVPLHVLNPEEVMRQRELVQTEIEQSTHQFKAFGLIRNAFGAFILTLVCLALLSALLTSAASACQENGPLAAGAMGLFSFIVFTGTMYFIAGNLDAYFHRASRIQVCPSGLRWLQGKNPRMAAWSDIASVERVTIDSCPRNTAVAAQFGLLGALAVAMSEPDRASLQRTGDSLTLILHDGERLSFSSSCLTEYPWFADSVYQWHSAEAKRYDPSHKFDAMIRTVAFPGRSNKTMLDYYN